MRIALAMVWSPFSSQSPSYITMNVMLSLQERFTLLFWVTLTITCSMCSIVAFRLRGTVGGGSVWAGLWSTLNLNAYLSKHNIFFILHTVAYCLEEINSKWGMKLLLNYYYLVSQKISHHLKIQKFYNQFLNPCILKENVLGERIATHSPLLAH